MKTERRHELQTNVLANSMAHWIEAARPYSKVATAVLIAIVVALFAWAWMSTQSSRRAQDGWDEYFETMSGMNPDPRESLRDLSQRYGDTMVGQWARLSLADIQLSEGSNRLLSDRTRANDDLREAAETFQALLLDATQPTIRQRAMFGLARAHETQGELDRAREEYKTLASDWPNSPFAAAAKERAKALEQKTTKTFYDWLAKYEPPPPITGAGTPGARPSFLEEPDAGGILDTPPMKEGGPQLPTVLGEPAAEPAPESDEPAASDSATPPAEADDEPAEAEPQPQSEPAPDEQPAPESSDGPQLK